MWPPSWRSAFRAAAIISAASGMATVWAVWNGPPVPVVVPPVFVLSELRELAGSDGPTHLRAARISGGTMRTAIARLGGDWSLRPTGVFAVEAVGPTGSVVIDPATDADCASDFLGVASYDAAAYARMQQALRRASAIVATHEHYDHICGLTRSPHLSEIRHAVRLTPEQLRGTAFMSAIGPEVVDAVEPFEVDGMRRVAPGVVMIEAPGHTPGSVWIYVREALGREWLFVGDTLWAEEALWGAHGKPWLSVWLVGEDWQRQGRLVRFLSDFTQRHPEVRVMVAHEDARWEALLSARELLPL